MNTTDTTNQAAEGVLTDEAQAVCDHVHALLKGPDGASLTGDEPECEQQLVCLRIPKAIADLATYLAIRQQLVPDHAPDEPTPFWDEYRNGTSSHSKALAKLRGAFLTKLLIDAGHLHLHHLAMGTHPALRPPEPPAEPAERLEELEVPF